MIKQAAHRVFVAAWMAAAPSLAMAGTATAILEVKTTITKECKVSSVTTLDFGTLGVMSSAVDSTATFSLQCTSTTTYAIGISAGNAVADPNATSSRALWGDSGLSYDLYRNAARDQHWGYSSNTLSGTGTGAAETITIYGRIPVQPTQAPDELEDFCVIVVSY